MSKKEILDRLGRTTADTRRTRRTVSSAHTTPQKTPGKVETRVSGDVIRRRRKKKPASGSALESLTSTMPMIAKRPSPKRALGRRRVAAPTVDEAPSPDGPEEAVHLSRLKELAAQYVQGLPPEQAEYWRLRYRDELSQERAAESMGITRRRARTLEAKIRNGLKKLLKIRGLDPDALW